MSKKGLTAKSSASQLWAEVVRLRDRTSAEVVEELRADYERARARERAALDELAVARMAASERGIAGDSFAGKPALAKMRRAWGDFADAVQNLPTVLKTSGLGGLRETVNKNLVADLNLFELDAPHGRFAALARDRLRRQLTAPAMLASLAADSPAGEYHRSLFLSLVARYFMRASVWRTYDKASDEGVRDGLGTVYK